MQIIGEFDTDGNGELDKYEFRSFAGAKFNIDASTADSLFIRIDSDRNGWINAEELRDHYYLLVRS